MWPKSYHSAGPQSTFLCHLVCHRILSKKRASCDLKNIHEALITVDNIPCEPTRKDQNNDIPLSKDKLDRILSPNVTHSGLAEILEEALLSLRYVMKPSVPGYLE